MGNAVIRGCRFSRHNAFPKGEGKEEAASPPKKEANPASLRSAAPSKGRGSRGRSLLPMEGGAPKGRRLDGDGGMKKSGEMRLKSTIYESTLSTAGAVPLPQWGRQRYENTAIPLLSERIYAYVGKTISTNKAFPAWGRQRGGGFAAFSEKILFEYVFFCAFVNDSGNFLNNNIKMIHDLKIGISNNEDSELF